MKRCAAWRQAATAAITTAVGASVFLLLGSLALAETTPPADPKLADAYTRLRFERQYPPEAVKLITERLQNANPALDELSKISQSDTADVRALAALLLGEYGDSKCAAPLWRLERDDSEFVRITAAGSLSHLASVTPISLELDGLTDKRPVVRRFTAATLHCLADKSAETALIDILHDDDALVRAEVVSALSACGTERCVPSVVEALQDKNAMVRTRAARTLGSFQDPSVLPGLIDAAKDPDWHVRAAAVLALGGLAKRGPGQGAMVADVLLARLEKDEYALVRDRAADALAGADDEKSIAALVKAVVSDDRDARFHAARALINSQARSAVPLLLQHKDHPNAEVRQKIVEICGALGDQEQMSAVGKELDDSDPNVRLAAVHAMRTMEMRTSSSIDIEGKLKDSSPHIRAASARTLGDLGRKDAVPQLITLLRDPNGYVRGAAAEALGKLGDRTAIQPLISVLSGERAVEGASDEGLIVGTSSSTLPEIAKMKANEQKIKAVQALSVLRAQEAVPTLISKGLKAEDPGLRAESAIALGVIKDPLALEPLQDVVRPYYATAPMEKTEDPGYVIAGAVPESARQMKEGEARVRASVAWALGQLADPATIPILSRAANDDNSLVREQAIEALQKISEHQEQALVKKQSPPATPPQP